MERSIVWALGLLFAPHLAATMVASSRSRKTGISREVKRRAL
jgi:hypothetical protein